MPNFEDFGAKRRNAEDCERIAEQIRAALSLGADERLPPVMELFARAREALPEARSLDLHIRDDAGVADGTAVAHPDSCEIHVGMDFVDGALTDRADVRFVAVHELMHILFHRGAPRYFKKPGGNVLVPFIQDKHESAEWQADRLARACLMPRSMVEHFPDAYALATAAGVPWHEAKERTSELTPLKKRQTPPEVQNAITELERQAAKGTAAQARAEANQLKLRLWNALPTVQGEEAALVRRCGKFQIHWLEFGKTTGRGWFIESGKIVSFFAIQSK